jgi:hypothetical protein
MLGIEKVIKEAGGQVALSKQLGVSQQAISIWHRQGWVPSSRLVEIEAQYGVPRLELVKPTVKELFTGTDFEDVSEYSAEVDEAIQEAHSLMVYYARVDKEAKCDMIWDAIRIIANLAKKLPTVRPHF